MVVLRGCIHTQKYDPPAIDSHPSLRRAQRLEATAHQEKRPCDLPAEHQGTGLLLQNLCCLAWPLACSREEDTAFLIFRSHFLLLGIQSFVWFPCFDGLLELRLGIEIPTLLSRINTTVLVFSVSLLLFTYLGVNFEGTTTPVNIGFRIVFIDGPVVVSSFFLLVPLCPRGVTEPTSLYLQEQVMSESSLFFFSDTSFPENLELSLKPKT